MFYSTAVEAAFELAETLVNNRPKDTLLEVALEEGWKIVAQAIAAEQPPLPDTEASSMRRVFFSSENIFPELKEE